MKIINSEFAEFIQDLTSWHERNVADLQLIVDKPEASISLGNGMPSIEAGSDKAKGVRVGIILALSVLGKLPFSFDEVNDDDRSSAMKNLEAQKKVDALSHECGMMAGLLNDICRYHEECTHNDQMHALIPMEYVSAINDFVARDIDGNNPCPLTDVFLNTVRADELEKFANVIRQSADRKDSEGFKDCARDRRDLAAHCLTMALQLRAGKGGE